MIGTDIVLIGRMEINMELGTLKRIIILDLCNQLNKLEKIEILK